MEKLYEKTLVLVRATDITVARLIADTGLGERWMYKLIAGQFSDPGVKKIQRLHDYLAAQQKKRRAA